MDSLESLIREVARLRGESIVLRYSLADDAWRVDDTEFTGKGTTPHEAIGDFAKRTSAGLAGHNERQLRRIGKRAMKIEAFKPIAELAGADLDNHRVAGPVVENCESRAG